MFEDRDLYQAYYTERLWSLLPGVYRASDSEDPGKKGPLRELVERLGAQIAVVRRSVDRTWEDQSIESSDDWLIPYIGDLLATNIVGGLDARAQRLDVANTIYYRRRKGTVAILEEIAADITGWNARVVEFFRRLARTRHQFDPEIGLDREQAVIEGLRGARSGTPTGGYADLRHAPAAEASQSAFDEYFHTADFRRGRSRTGWHNIPKLGVFLWRLKAYSCGATTPVEHASCPDQFTFDPTGREIALFARNVRDKSQYGDAWVTPDEWMLPGPITPALWDQEQAQLYPASLSVLRVSGILQDVLPLTDLLIHPERGRFQIVNALPAGAVPRVTYHYGFSSEIGAGPYDRRALGETLPEQPAPLQTVSGGGTALNAALAALPATGTLTIEDSLTYTSAPDVSGIDNIVIRGAANTRSVVRLTGNPWVLEGAGVASKATLEGILFSGVDLILRGDFEEVTLFCSTLDPGETPDATTNAVPQSVDGRDLVPAALWIEGRVARLIVRRSICGPIRTRGGGAVDSIRISDSIVQGVRTAAFGAFSAAEVFDSQRLARRLKNGVDPLAGFLRTGFPAPLQAALAAHDTTTPPGATLLNDIVTGLNTAITAGPIFTAQRFADIPLPPSLATDAALPLSGAALTRVNRLLLEHAFPFELSPAAIASAETSLDLNRTTILGRVFAHRISASETIFHEFARADDAQSGCVRFSAYADGSRLHQPYESVATRENAALFVSRRYGDPAYARLSALADREILSGGPGASIRSGAQNGSEMGAFAREKYAIKERGLRIKLNEFMPIGLTPILIFVT